MPVIATAGHVDHGKSTLVRALTGMEPDRWAEERRRGLTIDLGFAWTTLPSGRTVAFVDVPGHERFVPNMLAGVGPAPAVLFVVAADEGWMPQSSEHLAAVDALGVHHGLLVVTRTDRADPGPATAQARARLAGTSLATAPALAVSATTGLGLDALRTALDALADRLPAPATAAPVRLWVDRAFTIRGAGTVVTGTLQAGELRTGDELELSGLDRLVRVRGLQALGKPADHVAAVARVAVNLRGVDRTEVRRGHALLTPARFYPTGLLDVRLTGDAGALPPTATLHIGSAAVTARLRPLGDGTARLRLDRPLPLHTGDRALLRDPGRHDTTAGVTVLDVAPPPLRRRGAAARRAAELSTLDGPPDLHAELRRRRLTRRSTLEQMTGVPVTAAPVAADWLADPDWWAVCRTRLGHLVDAYAAEHPLHPAVPLEVLRQRLDLPDRALVEALVTPPLTTVYGRVERSGTGLPPELRDPVQALCAHLDAYPFRAPDAVQLAGWGLGKAELAAAARVGLLVRIADGVVLRPDAPGRAAAILATLPQPFSVTEARQALDTSRRVALPLLAHLDHNGATRRGPDDRRTVVRATPCEAPPATPP